MLYSSLISIYKSRNFAGRQTGEGWTAFKGKRMPQTRFVTSYAGRKSNGCGSPSPYLDSHTTWAFYLPRPVEGWECFVFNSNCELYCFVNMSLMQFFNSKYYRALSLAIIFKSKHQNILVGQQNVFRYAKSCFIYATPMFKQIKQFLSSHSHSSVITWGML